MEKRDVIMVVLGLAIVLVVAFVVKPMVTGKPVDMSIPATIPGMATPTPTATPVAAEDDSYARYKASQNMPQVTAVPTSTPTPTPSWSGQSTGLGMVDPARYNQTPTPTPIPHSGVASQTSEFELNPMVVYATIQGKDPGSTEPIICLSRTGNSVIHVDPYETTFVGTTGNKAAGVAELIRY